ncbi:fungal-specific transcription factor domain-containing protein [Aspergillus cavernicola]|uniref:Fungal-specific transcription factor domain-containing protein n=1 Tax=Aspergillus cavernicola TaxID=176166 RepID=A0ABR4IM89_9EURO
MFRCSQCDKTYGRKAHLQRHEVTHTGRAVSTCSFCKKSFLKPEVARRHTKTCATKHNQQAAPAAKPGRKRQSCDQCFSTKRACDKSSPCSRCHSLELQCTSEPQQVLSLRHFSSTDVSSASKDSSLQFSFLRHFTDPSVERDRLAIGTTAECSTRRNLETLYSHLEDALVPLDSMAACFGDFLGAEFFRPPLMTDDYLPIDFLTFAPTRISEQLNELMTDLIDTSRSMGLGGADDTQLLHDATQIAPLFTASSLAIYISAFFHSLHWHLPVVHFPTFDPGNVSNPLLLSIILTGATYSSSSNEAALLPRLLDVAEEHIFRKITTLSTQSAAPTEDLTHRCPTIQLIQAALIMEMLQFGQERSETRRRIRIIRHPSLVSLMRCLGLFHLKRSMTPTTCNGEDDTWKTLVAEEVCVRLASWVFLADGFLTLCFKSRPTISIFELDCSFPWRIELWEADDASTFNRIATAHGEELPLPSVREAVRLLLDNPDAGPLPSRLSLSAEHLLIIIYALNSLAFLARVDFLGSIPLEKIRYAANNWKQIWDWVSSHNEHSLLLGYPKHAEELWLLLTVTLDIAGRDTNLPYLDNTATDDLGKLNEFIQWCARYMKTRTGRGMASIPLSAAWG